MRINFFLNWFKNPSNCLFIGILLIAAFMRLYRIADYMTFLGDEGRDVLAVYGILHGHFTLLGPTASVGGFFFGPAYYYFMTPWLWLFHYNPVGPAVGIALASLVTMYLMYHISSNFFNKTTGIIATALYAIAPLVINYSHSSWNPNLMPLFSLLVIYYIYCGISKKEMKYLLFGGICLGIAIQLHYIELFLGGAIFLFILAANFLIIPEKSVLEKSMKIIKEYSVIGIGYIIGWSPFLAFEVRHGFQNTVNIYNFIFHSGDVKSGGNFFYLVQNSFFRSFSRLVTAFPPPDQLSTKIHPYLTLWTVSTWILALTATGYFVYVLVRQKHTTDKKLQLTIIALWYFTEIVLFGFYKKNIYDYYFESIFPVPFIFVGFVLSYLLSKKTLFKIVAAIACIALFAVNLNGIPFRYEPNRQLNQMRTIAKFVYDKSDGKPFNFALVTSGNSDHAYRYFFTLWGKPPVTIQNSVVDPKRATVQSQLFVVCESVPCAPLGASLWEIAGYGRAEIAGQWDVSVVKVYKLVPYKGK